MSRDACDLSTVRCVAWLYGDPPGRGIWKRAAATGSLAVGAGPGFAKFVGWPSGGSPFLTRSRSLHSDRASSTVSFCVMGNLFWINFVIRRSRSSPNRMSIMALSSPANHFASAPHQHVKHTMQERNCPRQSPSQASCEDRACNLERRRCRANSWFPPEGCQTCLLEWARRSHMSCKT